MLASFSSFLCPPFYAREMRMRRLRPTQLGLCHHSLVALTAPQAPAAHLVLCSPGSRGRTPALRSLRCPISRPCSWPASSRRPPAPWRRRAAWRVVPRRRIFPDAALRLRRRRPSLAPARWPLPPQTTLVPASASHPMPIYPSPHLFPPACVQRDCILNSLRMRYSFLSHCTCSL